jgi:uncharacterized membrane protein
VCAIPDSSKVAAISAAGAAIATLIPIALFQFGAIGDLPDPPGCWFDSNRITMAKSAHPFGVPDALLGLASYGGTLALVLAARGGSPFRGLLRGKLCIDGGMAAFNLVRQLISFRKVCSWCTGTALATAAMVTAANRYLNALDAGSGSYGDQARRSGDFDTVTDCEG